MSAGSRVGWCVALAFVLVACTDDFDSLFKGGGDAGAAEGGGGANGNACSNAASCTCGSGATCNTTCDADGTCTANASGGNLTYECAEHVDTCNVQCDGRSTCDVRCDAEGKCSMSCGENATCVLRCTGRSTSCTLTCDEAQRRDCGNGVFTCSQSCP